MAKPNGLEQTAERFGVSPQIRATVLVSARSALWKMPLTKKVVMGSMAKLYRIWQN